MKMKQIIIYILIVIAGITACNSPKTFIILCLSIVRIWSKTIQPILLSCLIFTLVGYFLELIVIGAIATVRKYLFISLGEITTHGLVFLISLPIVGSRFTRTIEYCFKSYYIEISFQQD